MDRRRFLVSTAALTAGTLTGNAAPKVALKIVSSLPRMGSSKVGTDPIVNGIKLALGEHNGLAGGFRVEYLDWDDADRASGTWTADKEAANAQKAAADPDVVAYIGPYNSGAAKVSMPLLNEAGLVQVSPACTYPGLTKNVPGGDPNEPGVYRPSKVATFCRVCPHDASQGPLAADFAKDELKFRSVYILDDKELYGQGVAAAFGERCEQLKIKVLGRESIDTRQGDFSGLMKKVAGLGPDLVYFGGTTQTRAGEIVKDAAGVNLKCPLIVPDGCYELAFIQSAGEENLKNCYVTMGGADPMALTGKGAAFVKRYKAKYDADPEAYAVYGYEAAGVVLAAIKKVAKNDREAIRKAVLGTKDYAGALGTWGFDRKGDTTLQQLTVSKVKDGKFVPVKVLTAK